MNFRAWQPGRPSGLKDEWDKVDAGVPSDFFLSFSHETWAAAGGGYEPSIGEGTL